MSSTTYNLHYWAPPGRAEQIRLALHVAGLHWENHVESAESYFAFKATSNKQNMNLPYLEFNGEIICESVAVLLVGFLVTSSMVF
jgi:hypothetical protein